MVVLTSCRGTCSLEIGTLVAACPVALAVHNHSVLNSQSCEMEKYKKKIYRFLVLQTTLRNLDRVQRENNTLNERLEYAGNFVSISLRSNLHVNGFNGYP